MTKPVVAVTFGDASGIGPELVARLLARPDALAAAGIVLVGDAWVWAEGQRIAGITNRSKPSGTGAKRAAEMARPCFWNCRPWRRPTSFRPR